MFSKHLGGNHRRVPMCSAPLQRGSSVVWWHWKQLRERLTQLLYGASIIPFVTVKSVLDTKLVFFIFKIKLTIFLYNDLLGCWYTNLFYDLCLHNPSWSIITLRIDYSQLSLRWTALGVALCVRVRDVHLIESQVKGVNKGRNQLQVSVLWRCWSYIGFC